MSALAGADGLRVAPGPSLRGRRDLEWTLLGLLLLALWELSGLDPVVAGWYGSAAGFAWRDSAWTRTLLYDGGRLVAAVLLIGMAIDAARRPRPQAPARAEKLYWLMVAIACLLLAPHFTLSSCPWDLTLFGGRVPYVPHWRLDLADGGPGHCFPSGHAVSGFAFLPLYFLWRRHDARIARAWLIAVLLLGAIAGWTQLVRGAHFPSHTLWSGWLCWTLAATAAWAAEQRRALALARGGRPAPVTG
jgi:membrane-associated PAP2 superfamily phosphatase